MENYKYFGLSWSKKSCWIDSSIMALFFPDSTYSVFFPFINNYSDRGELRSIRDETVHLIEKIRSNSGVASVNKLRSLLHSFAHQKNDPSLITAFEKEDVEGYVYYFLVQFLRLFDVKPITGFYKGKQKESYILEIENCGGSTMQECLSNGYKDWSWDASDYLIIEMTNSSLVPQEQIQWRDQSFHLASMVVYNCSHFITYVKKMGQWYLYDDTRTMSGDPIEPYVFGEHYTNYCRFAYGETNTFFFYVVEGK